MVYTLVGHQIDINTDNVGEGLVFGYTAGYNFNKINTVNNSTNLSYGKKYNKFLISI